MFDKLIESKNNAGENQRLGSFLFSTFTAAASVLTAALIYSLFTYNLAFGSGNLDQSALAVPVLIEEQTPPEKEAPAQKQSSNIVAINKLPTRRDNIMRVDEAPKEIPAAVSVVRNQQATRPNSAFTLSNIDSDVPASGAAFGESGAGGNGSRSTGDGIAKSLTAQPETIEKTEIPIPPPLEIKPKKPELPKKSTPVSGGVVNGKAINLVTPVYPPPAKAVRAAGEVKIQVTIDEDGSVIAANAVSGHPLLRSAAVSAARNSKFSPTFLTNQRVKVTGIIIYNFKQQ